VLHEYTSIEGVQEDVVDILLNLKSVALRMHTRDNAELRLHKKGPGPVTAGDIQTDHDIDVVNPELVIANLTKAGELNMTLRVERGPRLPSRRTARGLREQTRAIGRLQLDASFSAGAARYLLGRRRPCGTAAPILTSSSSIFETNGHHRCGRGDPSRGEHPEGSAVGVRRSAGRGGGRDQGLRDAVRSDSAAARR